MHHLIVRSALGAASRELPDPHDALFDEFEFTGSFADGFVSCDFRDGRVRKTLGKDGERGAKLLSDDPHDRAMGIGIIDERDRGVRVRVPGCPCRSLRPTIDLVHEHSECDE